MKYCRVCHGKVFIMDYLEGCLSTHPQVSHTPYASPLVNIKIYACETCKHIQIKDDIPSDFYDSYVMDSFNPNILNSEFVELNKSRFENLSKYSVSRDNILDIGCGAGDKLKLAQSYFNAAIGIEPSKEFFNIAKNQGLNVLHGYFDDEFTYPIKFSSFISTQVFEHLSEPVKILESAYKILEDGGVGLINVPDGDNILNSNEYFQIIPEHLNYFTASSLCALANRSGFEVLQIIKINFANELDLYVKKIDKLEPFATKKIVIKSSCR